MDNPGPGSTGWMMTVQFSWEPPNSRGALLDENHRPGEAAHRGLESVVVHARRHPLPALVHRVPGDRDCPTGWTIEQGAHQSAARGIDPQPSPPDPRLGGELDCGLRMERVWNVLLEPEPDPGPRVPSARDRRGRLALVRNPVLIGVRARSLRDIDRVGNAVRVAVVVPDAR